MASVDFTGKWVRCIEDSHCTMIHKNVLYYTNKEERGSSGQLLVLKDIPGVYMKERFMLEDDAIQKAYDSNGNSTKPSRIYVIGSLRNENIPVVSKKLREAGYEVFDDWYAAGPEADDYWKKYEVERGRSYIEALKGDAARNVYAFDKRNLDASDAALLVLPAGKSGHLELGYMAGKGKKTFILLDNPDRWDVMYQFATAVCTDDNMLEVINDKIR